MNAAVYGFVIVLRFRDGVSEEEQAEAMESLGKIGENLGAKLPGDAVVEFGGITAEPLPFLRELRTVLRQHGHEEWARDSDLGDCDA
jgi:hypothetical protein